MAQSIEVTSVPAAARTAIPPLLLEAACRPYRSAGRFAYHFARGRLRADPVYDAILSLGLLQGRSRVLNLGSFPLRPVERPARHDEARSRLDQETLPQRG
jgi:hypothetical protein